MMKVSYTGTSDFQEFSAADFKKAGVEGQNKVSFPKGVPTKVSDEAGQALISDEGVFGRHSFEQVDEADEEETTDADADSSAGVDADGTPQTGVSSSRRSKGAGGRA